MAVVPSTEAAAQELTSTIVLPAGFSETNDVVMDENTGPLLGPTAVTWAPDGRRFIAEKSGRVRVVKANGTLIKPPLIDLRARVNSLGDRGLLGIATDAAFADNGFLYLLYVYDLNPGTPDSDLPMVSRLTRVTVNPDNTLVNPSNPETVILGTYSSGPCPPADNNVDCIPADGKLHTIGTVRSDPVDGTLWVGTGDATPTSVQQQAFRTYDNASFAGKIIHIDRNGRGLPNHPFCPATTDLDQVCTKIYAKGFRNPFRFSLRANKGPVVGDVGNGLREELDLVKPGRSYGWPCYEGDGKMPGYSQTSRCAEEYLKEGTAEAHVGPNWTYAREGGASIIGGPVIQNDSYPQSYQGDVMVGDYVKGWIKRLEFDAEGNFLDAHTFATGWAGGVSLDMAPNGELSYVDLGWDMDPPDAGVRRFVYAPDDQPPIPVAKASPTSGEAPLEVHFDGDDSFDPEGDQLTYKWDFGDGSTSTQVNPTHVYTTPKTYTAKLTVDDGLNRNPTDTVSITVTGDSPPVATITRPTDGALYEDGTEVRVEGSATDEPDGSLTGGSLEWQILLHHGTHLHQVGTDTGTSTSFTTFDNHDSDSFYEIKLTATDSAGQKDTDIVEIDPETIPLTLASSPSGAPISYDSQQTRAAPFDKQATVGFQATIAADAAFTKNGTVYNFTGWSHGANRQHTYTIPNEATTLTAQYEAESGSPVNSSPPTIEGTAETGEVLTAHPGTWSGKEPMSYGYRWRRCPTYFDVVQIDAPLAHWRLGEDGGINAEDSSGHARDGAYVSAPVLGAPGALEDDGDTAVGFVESGDRMTVADDPEIRLNGAFSIEFWAKLNSHVNSYPGFMRKGSSASTGSGYNIFYTTDLRPNFKRAGLQKKSSAAAALSATKFRHYVVTYDPVAQSLKWYVDGQLDKSYGSTVFPENIDPSSLQIGRGDHYANHVLDEVALYDSALPADRIASHFGAGGSECSDIEGATGRTYAPSKEDVGARLKVRVTATNEAGAAVAASAPTERVLENLGVPPSNVEVPQITGAPNEGEILSASSGEWSGTEPMSFSYSWKRCPTYPSTVKADAPVAYWRLGEDSGTTANDASGAARNGRYENSPHLGMNGALTGDPNGAAGFVESGDRVRVGDDAATRLNGSFTIEFWAKLRSFVDNYPGMVRKGSSASGQTGYLVFYGSDLRPNLKRAGVVRKVTASGALQAGKFRHYVAAYDAPTETLKWFVDGTLNSTWTAVSYPTNIDPSALYLGRGDKYGDHVLDEIALYPNALSAGRVASHYAAAGQTCSEISDASEPTYTPTAADVGSRLRVEVTATNAAGFASASSPATQIVQPPPAAVLLQSALEIEGAAP
jgi:PKD repeat protein/glucose/arabinose dehydrogenase